MTGKGQSSPRNTYTDNVHNARMIVVLNLQKELSYSKLRLLFIKTKSLLSRVKSIVSLKIRNYRNLFLFLRHVIFFNDIYC